MKQHISKRGHILECPEVIFWNHSVFVKNLEDITVSVGLSPAVKGDKMIADVYNLLNAQLQIALDEGTGADIIFVLLPCNVFRAPKGGQVFPKLRYFSRNEFLVYLDTPTAKAAGFSDYASQRRR